MIPSADLPGAGPVHGNKSVKGSKDQRGLESALSRASESCPLPLTHAAAPAAGALSFLSPPPHHGSTQLFFCRLVRIISIV